MDEPTQDQPKKRRGWPKGVKRGPRKPKETRTPPPPAQMPPPPVQVPTDVYEPIKVSAVYKTGQSVVFSASTFEFTPTEYKFWSFPEQRGFRQLHVLQKAEVMAISVTAPERDFENLRAQPPTLPAHVAQTLMAAGPAVDPYPGGDPQVSIAPRGRSRIVQPAASVNRSSMMPGSPLPKSDTVEYDKAGNLIQRTTDAAMI